MTTLRFCARFRNIAAAAALVTAGTTPLGTAGQETLAAVLDRAGRYVVEFHRQLSGIVAEEHYVQEVKRPPRGGISRFTALGGASRRELVSDFLLVRLAGAERYVEFRDVFEVDGKPVRDRSERLVKLFLEPTASTADQVDHIVAESTRYNIGPLRRTVNVPVLALGVLDPVNQGRFRFKRAGDEKPILHDSGSAGDAPLSARVWLIEYHEVRPQTMIRTTNDRDMPSSGRFWIDPDTGRVLRSELVAQDTWIRGVIDVTYQAGPVPDLLVPVRMRERYDLQREGSRVNGTATYGRFRQFQVKVDEKIAPIK
jgi:hypothetical protein